MEKLEPIRDAVIVRPEMSETAKKLKEAGIKLPSNAPETAKGRGVVEAVGPGVHQNGVFVPTCVKVGDVVLFQSYEEPRDIGGEKFHVIRESMIDAVVKTE